MTEQTFDPHQVLGVPHGATTEEILAAHRKHIRRIHPDAGGTDGLAAVLNRARDMLLEDIENREGTTATPTPSEPPTRSEPPTWTVPLDEHPPPLPGAYAPQEEPSRRRQLLFLTSLALTVGIAAVITVVESIGTAAAYTGLYVVFAGGPIGYVTADHPPAVPAVVRWVFAAGAFVAALGALACLLGGAPLAVLPMIPMAVLGAISSRSLFDARALPVGGIRFDRHAARRDPRAIAVAGLVLVITIAAGAIVAVELLPLAIGGAVLVGLLMLLGLYLKLTGRL